MTTLDPTASRTDGRWGPAMGVAAALLFLATFLLVGHTSDSAEAAAKELPEHDQQLLIAFVTGTLCGLALLAFFAWLGEVIRAAAPQRMVLARLSLAAAATGAALLPGSLAILAGVASAGKNSTLSPGVAAFAREAQFPFLAGGVMAGGVAAFCAMLALKGTAAVPGWLCWSGLVVGVLALAALVFVPILLFFLWVLIAGGVLLARPPAAATA